VDRAGEMKVNSIDRIKEARKQLGINQGEFAKRVGLSQNALSMVEVGKNKLTEKNIKIICTTFAINEKWLRTGDGEMFCSPSPHEKELLELFRCLPQDLQELLLDMAKRLLKNQEAAGKKD
jgi:transcriptional regulator with XRE-family HTH domain